MFLPICRSQQSSSVKIDFKVEVDGEILDVRSVPPIDSDLLKVAIDNSATLSSEITMIADLGDDVMRHDLASKMCFTAVITEADKDDLLRAARAALEETG